MFSSKIQLSKIVIYLHTPKQIVKYRYNCANYNATPVTLMMKKSKYMFLSAIKHTTVVHNDELQILHYPL